MGAGRLVSSSTLCVDGTGGELPMATPFWSISPRGARVLALALGGVEYCLLEAIRAARCEALVGVEGNIAAVSRALIVSSYHHSRNAP